ncbi:MAG: SdrD B-like domain-containing protein [Ferruginibacter sp.]
MKKSIPFVITVLFFAISHTCLAQYNVSGLVYRDYDNNGTLTAASNEAAMAGITVKAFNAAGTNVATTISASTGASNYTLLSLPNGQYRIEFSGLSLQDAPSFKGTGNNTNVQFITISGTNVVAINFGVNNPSDYSETNPWVIAAFPRRLGTESVIPGFYELNDGAVVKFRRDGTVSGRDEFIASVAQVGAGVSTVQTDAFRQRVFVASARRSEQGQTFGPGADGVFQTADDPNAIYIFNANLTYTPPAAPPAMLGVINIPNPGTNGSYNNALNTRIGIGDIAISDDGNTLWTINLFDKHLYRVNIIPGSGFPVTDMGVIATPTGIIATDWIPYALEYYHGKLYIGGIATGQSGNPSTITTLQSGVTPSALLSNTNNTAYTTNDNIAGVQVHILEITTPLTSITGSFVFAKTNMTYNRGLMFKTNADMQYDRLLGRWRAWTDIIPFPAPNFTTVYVNDLAGNDGTNINAGAFDFPMPILFDLEIEANGSFILGFKDRFIDFDYSGYSNGDIKKAVWVPNGAGTVLLDGVNGNWAWEGDAGATFVQRNSPSEADAGVHATSEWFANDNSDPTQIFGHEEQSFGGLAYKPTFLDVANSSMNPFAGPFNAGGVDYFLTTNGADDVGGAHTPYDIGATAGVTTGQAQSGIRYRKANSIGDIEYLSTAQSIQIGNRIWVDTNNDGLQGANETTPGVPTGTTVTLLSPGLDGIFGNADDQTWTTTTDSNGNYYFDNTNVSGDNRSTILGFTGVLGILPNQNYRIIVAIPASSYVTITAAIGDNINNDATTSGANAIVNFNTATTNHNFDIGFTTAPLAVEGLSLEVNLKGTQAYLNWKTIVETNTNYFEIERSTTGSLFETIKTNILASGNSSSERFYSKIDETSTLYTNNYIYYRIKLFSNDGKYTFSNIALVKTKATEVKIWPNPVVEKLLVNIDSKRNEKIAISIMDFTGRIVAQQYNTVSIGKNQLIVSSIATIQKGVYTILVTQLFDNTTSSFKIIKN